MKNFNIIGGNINYLGISARFCTLKQWSTVQDEAVT